MANSESGLPQKSTGDHVHTGIRIALGSVPVVGSAAVELFNELISPPLAKRRDKWCEELANKVHELHLSNRINIDDLSQNESFVSAAMFASQAAMKSQEKEKLEALRNAILNSALPNPLEESIQQIFISLVDDFTVWHLRFLKLFSAPEIWFRANGVQMPDFAVSGSLIRVLQAAYPALAQNRPLYELIASTLESRRLFSGGGMQTMMSTRSCFDKRTTDFGDQFLRFIEEPQN